jgi:receptor expression-enhancing protein 5/6
MSATQKLQQHPVFIQAQSKANHYINQFDKEACLTNSSFSNLLTNTCLFQLTKYPALSAFEQRTQVPKAYAVLGGFFLLTVLLAINPLASPVSNLVGWLIPAYLSFKAIESPSPNDDVQWLTYWVVFGFFNFIESFALRLVLYYLPWYFAIKTTFIVWLQLPAFRVRLHPFVAYRVSIPPFYLACRVLRVHVKHGPFFGPTTLLIISSTHSSISTGCANYLCQCPQATPK